MKVITLPNSLKTLVDDLDFEYLNQWKWYVNSNGYVARKLKNGKHERLHRAIMNPPKGMDVDHINKNKLDNQKVNLRICNRSENNLNTKLKVNNTSNYKGVSWDKRRKSWRAFGNINSERFELGYFKNKDEAIRARKLFEIDRCGEFIEHEGKKKVLFIASYRSHIARQKLLLDELGKRFNLYIREYNPSGDDMAEKALKMADYANAVIQKVKPDLLLVRGDRLEVLPIAAVGVYNGVKICHCEGGDLSGVIDNKMRHAITQLSNFHFATNEESQQRLISAGISPNVVWNFGSLDVEFAASVEPRRIRQKPYIFVAYHPIHGEDEEQLSKALESFKDFDVVTVASNKDYGRSYGEEVFSPEDYINLLRYADCLVGNSSSFLKEASLTGVGVVNIGSRQDKRLKPKNVLDVPCDSEKIKRAIEFQLLNKYEPDDVYYQPETSKKIADKLKEIL